MSQQKRQNSLGLKKVGFAAIATSILSVAFLATQTLSFQDSYEAIDESVEFLSAYVKFQKLNEHKTGISSVAFSPDGKMLASAGDDGTVKLWNVATGKNLKILKGHSAAVSSVSFSPNGKTIASASADKTIKIWSLEGNLKKVLQGHDAEVTKLNFCPDNQVLVSGSADNTISLWRRDGKLVKTFPVRDSIRNVACSSDSKMIAVSSDKIVRFWNQDGQELQTYKLDSLANRGGIYFISDKKDSLIAHDDSSKLLIPMTTSQPRKEDSLILEDGATATINTATSVQETGDISTTFSDVENDRTINASIGSDNTIILLRKDGLLLRTLKHNKPVRTFAFHPNHKIIASGCDDGTISIWDVNTGQIIHKIQVHEGRVSKIHYSPDGQKITSTSDDGIVKEWYPDSPSSKSNFLVVITVLALLISGSTVLFFVPKPQQSKGNNQTSNTQSNYIITGWVVYVFPEDWRGDLEALRYELIIAKKPIWYVRLITVTTLLDMLLAGIKVKFYNLSHGNNFMAVIGRRSTTDSKDNSANHQDLNE